MRHAWAVSSLIALCVGVFAWEMLLARAGDGVLEDVLGGLGLVPRELVRSPWPRAWSTPLTSMALHAGPLHLASNLVFLLLFGPGLERRFGGLRLLAFVVACGWVAAAAQVAADPDAFVPVVGASGAVSGVLGGSLRLTPGRRVARVPAVAWVAAWGVIQILSAVLAEPDGPAASGGTAAWAHAGGFAAGVVLAPAFCGRDASSRSRS